MWSWLLDFLAPRTCTECGQWGSWLCSHCYEQIVYFPQPIKLNLDPLYVDEFYVMAHYQAPIPALLHTLKYQSVKGIGTLLAEMAYHAMYIPESQCLTAVPLHPRRLDERGFNQAEVIAQRLAFLVHRPYAPLLQRIQYTSAQAHITDRAQRLHRLSTAFAVFPATQFSVTDSVLIVDDVTTTGATLNECARILKNVGWKQVLGLTIAHGQ